MADNLLDGFDELSDQIESQRQTALAAAYTGNDQKPDHAARANQLSDQLGQPFGVVAANLDEYEQDARRQQVEAAAARAPHVAEFLSDPRRMAIASDDADGLANLAGQLQRQPSQAAAQARGWTGILDRWLALPGNAPARGLLRAGLGTGFQQGATSSVASLWHALTDAVGQIGSPLAGVAGHVSVVGDDGSVDAAATERLRGVWTDPIGARAQASEAAAVQREVEADQQAAAQRIGGRPTIAQFRADPAAATEQFFAYYGNQGSQSLPAMLLALATRNPHVGGAVMGVTTGAQTYTDLRNDGIDRRTAFTAGFGTGLIESSLGAAGLEAATRPGIQALTRGPLVEAGTEGLTQWGQTDVEDWAKGQTTPLPERLSQVLDAAILGAGFGVAEKVGSTVLDPGSWQRAADLAVEQGQRALRSADNADKLEKVAQAAAGLKLGQRSPADLEAFVQQAGGDGNVYIEAGQAQTLFQSSPELLVQLVGSEQLLAEQRAAGDLVIPMARWAAVVPQLANAAEITRHSRMNADDLSAAEMDAMDVDALAAEMGIPATEPEGDAAAVPDTRAQVQQDVMAQLVGTGRYTPAAAEAQAKLWAAAFGRFADSTGQDAMSLYQRYSTGVQAVEAPAATPAEGRSLMQRGLDALRGVFGRPSVSTDARGQQTIRRDGSAYVQRAGQWLLADEQGQARDFLTLNQARTEADRIGGEVVQDDPIEGQRQTWSVALPDTAAREALSGDILFQSAAPEPPAGAKLRQRWNSDFDAVEREYNSLSGEFDSRGGVVLNTDLARELSPEYREDRTRSADVHEAASDFIKELYRRKLAGPTPAGKDPVVLFTAGGTGAGKTTGERVLAESGSLGNPEIVYDTNMNGLASSRQKIEQALAAEREVTILYTFRDPVDALVNGALPRARRMAEQEGSGRTVPLSEHARTHEGSYSTMKELWEQYADDPRVGFRFIDNSRGRGNATEVTFDQLVKLGENAGYERRSTEQQNRSGEGAGVPQREDVGARLRQALEAEHAAGRISEAIYRGFAGQTLNQDPAAGGVSASGAPPRGQIQIAPDRSMQISLFEGADRSTFIHESGHFFLEVYRDLAQAEGASPQLQQDFDALLKWLGVESADQIGVDQHEQFARGFEAYLGEGKAPTPELQSVFSQFKQWMLGIYRTLRNLNVELTDDVRGVFDRMLASEEEIAAAQARTDWQPLVADLAEARALGMTERQFADYQAQVAATIEQAKADVQAELEQADARQRERWWKEELANVRAEVQAEVEATSIVRAYRVLTGRKEAAGAPVPENLQGLKLDRAALAAVYGDGLLQKLGRVYARSGGVHQDEAAALLGFSSGDELVQGLWTVQQTLAGVNSEAEARMRARHGDPQTDGTLPQRAMDAIHGNRRIQLLEREMGLLADLASLPRPDRRQLKAVAQAVIARKTARQLRPNDYLAAERKAARTATTAAAAGRYGEALQAKRQQALNVALYAEARAVAQEVESKVGFMRRQVTPAARERLGKAGRDYLEAMDAIAETYEFRDVSARAVARRESLRAWVEARQADDDITAISDDLLARVEAENVTNYADLTIAEFRELHEAVTNIARLAKLKNQLLKNQDQRAWSEAQAELADSIRTAIAAGKPLPFSEADRTRMQQLGAAYTGLMDWVLRPETVVEWLDGGESGPWHDYLWNQAEAAQQHRIDLRNRVGSMLAETMNRMTADQRADLQRIVHIQALGRPVSKNTIVAVALNMGNAGNRDKLMRGGYIVNGEVVQFTPEAIAEMLGNLTPADAQMVQGIWDAVNSLWPDIVEQQRNLSGVAPEQVEPMPLTFTAADGSTVSLRGGYYPAVYDPRASAGGVKQAMAAEEQIMGGTFSRAMTSKGHTKERTDYAAPMLLDYHRVLSRHLNDVITDLSHRAYVKQASRVLEDTELKGLIQERLSEGAYHALYGGVKNAVRGASVAEPGSSMAEKIGDAVLTNTAVAALGFRIPLVLANTVVAPIQAASRVDAKWMAKGFTSYYRHPVRTTEMIHQLSPFMVERANSLDSTYQQVLGKLAGKRGIRAAAMKMAMEVHRWTVPLAERAIWLGRYQQAQAAGSGIEEAVRLADKSIRMTQQAGAPKDLSAAERDPRYKWVRMFIGPMIIMNNRLQESGLRGLYLGRVQSPARALGTWLSAAVLSNAVFELLSGRGPDDGDDDELTWDDWASWLARKSLLFPLQTIPLLRDVASGIDAAIEGKPSMGRPNPIVDAGVALARFGQTAWREGRDWVVDDEEPDAEKLAKTGIRAAGPLTGIPSNQMLTTGEYLYDVGTGQYTPDNPAEAAGYLIYKRPKDKQ